MEIPVRWVYDRNSQESKALIGDGRRGMALLERLMQLRRLAQLSLIIEPYPGALIKVSKVFGIRSIEIVVTRQPIDRVGFERKECLCLPHFAMGIVQTVYPELPTLKNSGNDPSVLATRLEEYREFLIKGAEIVTYDVLVCAGDKYILVKDAVSPGWCIYSIGQFFIASIGSGLSQTNINSTGKDEYDRNRKCLMQNPQFSVLITSPINCTNEMKKWRVYLNG